LLQAVSDRPVGNGTGGLCRTGLAAGRCEEGCMARVETAVLGHCAKVCLLLK
jgi:hypothetical protein